jgi:hypothetical protein
LQFGFIGRRIGMLQHHHLGPRHIGIFRARGVELCR